MNPKSGILCLVLIAVTTLTLGCAPGRGARERRNRAISKAGNLSSGMLSTPPTDQQAAMPDAAVAETTPYVICGVFIDATSSVDTAVQHASAVEFADALQPFVDRNRCSEIRFATFAEEGAFLIPHRVVLTIPSVTVDCSRQMSTKTRSLKFLPGASGSAEEQCREQLDIVQTQAVRRRAAELAGVRAFLTADVPRRGACTNLVGLFRLLNRSRSKNDVDVLLSDGSESCAEDIPHLTLHHRIYLIECPRSGDLRATGPEALDRAVSLEKHIEGVAILLPAEVSPELWQRLESAADEPEKMLQPRTSRAPGALTKVDGSLAKGVGIRWSR